MNKLCHPIDWVAHKLHDSAKVRRRLRHWIGAVFMLVGVQAATMAAHADLPHVAHVLVDTVAFAIHALGATPFIMPVIKTLELE